MDWDDAESLVLTLSTCPQAFAGGREAGFLGQGSTHAVWEQKKRDVLYWGPGSPRPPLLQLQRSARDLDVCGSPPRVASSRFRIPRSTSILCTMAYRK